jgi:hypothetical protein
MAAHPLKGEASFVSGGVAYTLAYDINALVLAEEAAGITVSAILTELDRGASLKTLRAMIWAGLQRDHECHVIQAGEIMSLAGVNTVNEAMRKALAAAFPVAEAASDANPPKRARAGTGSRS